MPMTSRLDDEKHRPERAERMPAPLRAGPPTVPKAHPFGRSNLSELTLLPIPFTATSR